MDSALDQIPDSPIDQGHFSLFLSVSLEHISFHRFSAPLPLSISHQQLQSHHFKFCFPCHVTNVTVQTSWPFHFSWVWAEVFWIWLVHLGAVLHLHSSTHGSVTGMFTLLTLSRNLYCPHCVSNSSSSIFRTEKVATSAFPLSLYSECIGNWTNTSEQNWIRVLPCA